METQPWKRLLWLKQNYPDNYTDHEFIEEVKNYEQARKNYRNSPYSKASHYARVRSDFLNFYQNVLETSFIFITFAYIYHYKQDPVPLFIMVTITVSFVLFLRRNEKDQISSLLNTKSIIILVFSMLTLSPVLKSLSKTTASDSIWTLSFWLTLTYISSLSNGKEKKTSNVSTNLLVAITSILASRLSTTNHVFCFLLICIQINIVLPSLLIPSYLRTVSSNVVVYTFITKTLGWCYTIPILCVSLLYIFVLPQWFVYWQIHYRRIDDAKDNISDSLTTSWDARKSILD